MSNPMDYAEEIDSGTLKTTQVDEGTGWVQEVIDELSDKGWQAEPAPFGFNKAATIHYYVKEERSVSFLTTYFMGTYTEIRPGTRGKEFRGFND